MHYLISFIFYTLAMIGVIFIGFVVAKKSLSMSNLSNQKNRFLMIESCLNLEPRKTLYVVKAGKERFLVATDGEGSRFLTKLEVDNMPISEEYKLDNVQIDSEIPAPILNFATNVIQNNPLPQNNMVRRVMKKINSNS